VINKKVYIETYGCQMNFSDSEIVASIVKANNYDITSDISQADIIFLNTCSIRENAEQKIHKRLRELKSLKKLNQNLKIGLLGCMAERLKENLLKEEALDLIVGPDAYRDLPKMLTSVEGGIKSANVILSEEETYEDIEPVRMDQNGVSAFISIMRGCQNFCSYCVVPYTRGKERSRNPITIIEEVKNLYKKGYREITLLGQNVNSYNWDKNYNFARLIKKVAEVNPQIRVRFATSHPKDLSYDLIKIISEYSNICKSIHLPVQSGSSRVLKNMNRKYTREWYLSRIAEIKNLIPDCSISTDIISGFPGETEFDHNETLSLMEQVCFDYAFMFKYSERPDTFAAKNLKDDVDDFTKSRRLTEIIELQNKLSLKSNNSDIGKTFEVLVDSYSKRSQEMLSGRNSQNKVVIFPKKNYLIGQYVMVKISDCTSATLISETIF